MDSLPFLAHLSWYRSCLVPDSVCIKTLVFSKPETGMSATNKNSQITLLRTFNLVITDFKKYVRICQYLNKM